ncbi:MAG: CDP-alcohol phosphatidyltransferase family protein [Verrucomicrobiales bacterium]|nr:CDP-alcohol phosphatidyltransferase family protein [Verrucomicrobiales bacterium]
MSVCSVGFATLAACSLWLVSSWNPPQRSWLVGCWIAAVVGIQGRLWCNLMDGMLAVEGGLKTPNGELYNEVPDRVADSLILIGAGFSAGVWSPWAANWGWAAALVACSTAYVRVLGASLVGQHDFRGPMAKPHRMALLTLACVTGAGEQFMGRTPVSLQVALVLIVILGIVTCIRRLSGISELMRGRVS